MTYYEETRLRRKHISEMILAGHTYGECAQKFGVSKRTVHRAAEFYKLTKPRSPLLTPEEIQRVEAMLDDGCSYGEIAKTLGRSKNNISQRWRGRSKFALGMQNTYRRMREQLEAL